MTKPNSDLSLVVAFSLIVIAACQGLQTGFQILAILEADRVQQQSQEQFRQGMDEIRQAQEAAAKMRTSRPVRP